MLLLGALGDVHGLVTDALEVGHEPERGGEEAQVVGDGLTQREDAQDERVDIHLVAVDVPVELLHLRRELGASPPEGLEREAQARARSARPWPASGPEAPVARTRSHDSCAIGACVAIST